MQCLHSVHPRELARAALFVTCVLSFEYPKLFQRLYRQLQYIILIISALFNICTSMKFSTLKAQLKIVHILNLIKIPFQTQHESCVVECWPGTKNFRNTFHMSHRLSAAQSLPFTARTEAII